MVLGFEQPSSIEPNRRHSGRNPRSCSRQDFEQPRLARIASAQLEPRDFAFQVSPRGSTCISCSSYSAQRKARILSTGIVIFSGPSSMARYSACACSFVPSGTASYARSVRPG